MLLVVDMGLMHVFLLIFRRSLARLSMVHVGGLSATLLTILLSL